MIFKFQWENKEIILSLVPPQRRGKEKAHSEVALRSRTEKQETGEWRGIEEEGATNMG